MVSHSTQNPPSLSEEDFDKLSIAQPGPWERVSPFVNRLYIMPETGSTWVPSAKSSLLIDLANASPAWRVEQDILLAVTPSEQDYSRVLDLRGESTS